MSSLRLEDSVSCNYLSVSPAIDQKSSGPCHCVTHCGTADIPGVSDVCGQQEACRQPRELPSMLSATKIDMSAYRNIVSRIGYSNTSGN